MDALELRQQLADAQAQVRQLQGQNNRLMELSNALRAERERLVAVAASWGTAAEDVGSPGRGMPVLVPALPPAVATLVASPKVSPPPQQAYTASPPHARPVQPQLAGGSGWGGAQPSAAAGVTVASFEGPASASLPQAPFQRSSSSVGPEASLRPASTGSGVPRAHTSTPSQAPDMGPGGTYGATLNAGGAQDSSHLTGASRGPGPGLGNQGPEASPGDRHVHFFSDASLQRQDPAAEWPRAAGVPEAPAGPSNAPARRSESPSDR